MKVRTLGYVSSKVRKVVKGLDFGVIWLLKISQAVGAQTSYFTFVDPSFFIADMVH